MKCPVCDKVNTSMLCPRCGFDSSGNCERYPTLGPVGQGNSVSALRREWQEKQRTELPAEPEVPVQTASELEIAAQLQDRQPIPVTEELRKTVPIPPDPPKKKRNILPTLIYLFILYLLCLSMWIEPDAGIDMPAQPVESPQMQEPAQSEQMNVTPEDSDTVYRLAMITDYGEITDQSFNQITYEVCRDFVEGMDIEFHYYRPVEDSTAHRVAMVDCAVMDGFNVIVMAGYKFAEVLNVVAEWYPEIKFIALDVDTEHFSGAENVYCANFREEMAGYMAGYAAVKMGYRHLGFLGGIAEPAVQRYGYGYLQGIDAAANELNAVDQVKVEYIYGNQSFGDANVTAIMDMWYHDLGVEVVFACGGGIWTSAADAAGRNGGKVIGADVDQSAMIDSMYGAGITLTSAAKGLEPALEDALNEVILNDMWDDYGGKTEVLGMKATDTPDNYVQLPLDTTQWNDSFTQEDYGVLVKELRHGIQSVSADTSEFPQVAVAVEMWPDIYS